MVIMFHARLTNTYHSQNCREVHGVHTCDQRRSRSYIQTRFPHAVIEEGFREEDELWLTEERETMADIANRARLVLDMIFDNDDETCKCSPYQPIPVS